MLSFEGILGTVAVLAASVSLASAATVATISGDGIYASNDSGLFVLGEFGGEVSGLVVDDLPTYHYSAFVWAGCEVNEEYEGDGFPGCPVSEEPTLGGTVSGEELFGFFGDPEPEAFVDMIAAGIGGLSFDGTPNEIDLGFFDGFLSINVLDGFVGEDGFFGLAAIYFGDDASCADFFGTPSDVGVDSVYSSSQSCLYPYDPDGGFSLRMSIDDKPNVVPLPAGFTLLVAGLGALGLAGRRRPKKAS